MKTSALNTRLFANLCADLSSDYKCLLFYTEVRWLSRGNMARRVFELRNELLKFYEERNHNFKNDLTNTKFLLRLAYLSDIFDTLNRMNMFFQGPNSTIADFVMEATLVDNKYPGQAVSHVQRSFFASISTQRKVISKNLLPSKNGVDALFSKHR